MFSSQAKSASSRAKLLLGLALALAAAPVSAAPMFTGGLTSQPIGHFEFCKRNPAECAIRTPNSRPEHMTTGLWRLLTETTRAVNSAVEPMNDIDIYGKDEVWAYPDGRGDCEDYVLEKRRRLKERGLSIANLLITVVKKPDGEGHAILTVRTDAGDFILDNLNDAVRDWEETGYRFLKRQASDNTGHWVAIRDGQTPMVAAVDSVR